MQNIGLTPILRLECKKVALATFYVRREQVGRKVG